MRTYLHDPVTPHKKADPLIMSKRLRLAAVSLKKKTEYMAERNSLGVNALWVTGSGGGSVV